MQVINKDLVKARINELQSDIERVKSNLKELQESAKGNFGTAEIEKVDMMTKELIALKSGQAELIGLLS